MEPDFEAHDCEVYFYSDKKDQWGDFLDTCVYSYNTAKHESTTLFGRKAILPLDPDFESLDGECLLNEYRTSEFENVRIHLITYCCIQITCICMRNYFGKP